MSQSDGWDPTREVYLGALRRLSAGDRIRWFTAPNQFTSDVMNAYEEGSRIHFDTCVSPGNLFPFFGCNREGTRAVQACLPWQLG
jgi:carotenoid cleavage dioxygenase-like enzyme